MAELLEKVIDIEAKADEVRHLPMLKKAQAIEGVVDEVIELLYLMAEAIEEGAR